MTISGIDIDIFGLKLIKLQSWYDLPARKKILSIPAFGENDVKHEPRRALVRLFGKYDDLDELAAGVNAFRDLLESDTQHDCVIGGRNISFPGVVAGGFSTTIKKNTVQIELILTILET